MSEQPCTTEGFPRPHRYEPPPSTAAPPPDESHSSNSNRSAQTSNDGSNSSFDCNICLDLAQDPVVTLCGHLFCWPCLYRWLRRHSTCQECPVCKAVVMEDKVVPLYGRGNTNPTDPRQKKQNLSDADGSIPHRPAGPRPETARPPPPEDAFNGPLPGFAFSGVGPVPMATARFGNFTFSAGFGLFPSLFGIQMHGIPDYNGFGHTYPSFVSTGYHGAPVYNSGPDQQEAKLSRLLMCLGFLVFFYILFF